MKNHFFKIILFFSIVNMVSAQETVKNENFHEIKIGLNFGSSSQSNFLFDDPDYLYENNYVKIQFNRLLKKVGNFKFEQNFEPSIYFSKHQLLNKHFVQPKHGDDYLEQRKRFVKRKSFKEYALNIGLITRYELVKDLSTYLLLSIGPMISEKETERLHKGFAFSDIIALGTSYQVNKFQIDLRLTLRHNSNADIYENNSGHNSLGFESGVLFKL